MNRLITLSRLKSAKRASAMGRIIILSGPSGSGKTTLHKALLEDTRFKNILVKSISVTTRAKRAGEREARDYLFINEETFARRIRRSYFLEWEKVFDHFYGTPKAQVLNLLKKGQNVLMCIDVKGAEQISQQFPRAIKIFIKPPSMKELKLRLEKRASESKESLTHRLAIAREEIRRASEYDHIIINRSLELAKCELLELMAKVLSI